MRKTRTLAELGLTATDRRRLTRAMRRATLARVFRRMQSVLLVAQGRPVPEVAQITGLSPKAVYDCLNRYRKAHRVEVLGDLPRCGRPEGASAITDARIVREFRRDPLRLGYNGTGWTTPLLAAHLSRKYGCPISTWTLRRRLRRLGLRWKRPRYAYATKDPHRAQKKGGSFAA
jgi:transposase